MAFKHHHHRGICCCSRLHHRYGTFDSECPAFLRECTSARWAKTDWNSRNDGTIRICVKLYFPLWRVFVFCSTKSNQCHIDHIEFRVCVFLAFVYWLYRIFSYQIEICWNENWKLRGRKKSINHESNPCIESKWQWTPIGHIHLCIAGESTWSSF